MRGSDSTPQLILNLDTRWRRVVSFTFQRVYPRERVRRSNWIGEYAKPRAALEALGKGTISSLSHELKQKFLDRLSV